MWRIGAVRMADCRRWETFHMFCRAIRTNHKDVHVGIVKTFANRLALMSFVLGMDHIVEDQRPGPEFVRFVNQNPFIRDLVAKCGGMTTYAEGALSVEDGEPYDPEHQENIHLPKGAKKIDLDEEETTVILLTESEVDLHDETVAFRMPAYSLAHRPRHLGLIEVHGSYSTDTDDTPVRVIDIVAVCSPNTPMRLCALVCYVLVALFSSDVIVLFTMHGLSCNLYVCHRWYHTWNMM